MTRTRVEQLEIEKAALLRINRRLLDQCAILRSRLPQRIDIPPSWGLTTCEGVIVGALLKREVMSTDALLDTLYSGCAEPKGDGSLKVFIYRARKALAKLGVRIENKFGFGYFIRPEDRRRLLNMAHGIHEDAA